MRDLRLAIRTLRATPVVTILAIASLALGSGANGALFTLVDSLLLRSLPVRDPDRLVLLSDSVSTTAQYWSYGVWEQIQQRPELFEAVAAWAQTRLTLGAGAETTQVDGAWVSGSYFDTLGVHAAVGRTIGPADDRPGGGTNGPVAVISDALWQRQFARSPDVLDRHLAVNGAAVFIIGVMPKAFFGTDVGRSADVVLPIADEPLINGRDSALNGGVLEVAILGRLRRADTRDVAIAQLRAVQPEIREATRPAHRIAAADPFLRDYLAIPLSLIPAGIGNTALVRRYVEALLILTGAAAFVLLVACANVANVLLARATARRYEFSIRAALGASRWQLIRQVLVESAVLALIAAASAWLIALWASRLLVRELSTRMDPIALNVSPDGRVLTFAVLLAIVTILIAGLVPAFGASAQAPIEALNAHGRATGPAKAHLQEALVLVQVALSLVLVVAAGLFVRSFVSLVTRDPGFARDEVLVVRIDSERAIPDPTRRAATYAHVWEAVRALPGVADAALSTLTPVNNLVFDPPIDVSGADPRPARERAVYTNIISPGWFRTLGIPLLRGRDLAERDGPGAPPVAVVNEAFARKFLGGASPLDHLITLPEVMTRPAPNVPLRIVGVVADSVYVSLREPPRATMYLPIGQRVEPFFLRGSGQIQLTIRATSGSPARLAHTVGTAIEQIDPQLTLTMLLLADQVDESLARDRVMAMIAGFFGVLAVLLAGLGLYGMTAYVVTQRRTEIGIRLALGARPARIMRWVMSRVLVLVTMGVAVGTVLSVAISRLAGSLLYGVAPRDPITLAAGAITLALIGVAAGWLPAWMAAQGDPAVVLRER